ncbi:MAG: 50S ribosomal protein L9 [Gammaproteobacteria bacterium]|nr:50S ribosomal protein L9 [Gammaproteobacteria bacterium]NNF60306.1 50S ribosomal protein L9 [Gammaproteobacteria bacterium]NNM20414.1 50S ribosomal protein L9 [Gammaproteobacteria bacterium]
MEVILLEKVENLGGIGERVKVRSGYARNFLLPKGKAAMATRENIERVEAMRAELEMKAATELEAAALRAEKVRELEGVTVAARVGAEGKLFGSVGTVDIAAACERAGLEIARSEVRLPEGPLRIAGEHAVEIHLHTEISVPLTVTIVAEE